MSSRVRTLAFAALAIQGGASRASQPDLLARGRNDCAQCIEHLPGYLQPCADIVKARGGYGDVIVKLARTPGTGDDNPNLARGTLTASATDGLGTRVATCAGERLRRSECLAPCYVDASDPIDIALGQPRPLLPDVTELLPRWRALNDSSWLTRWWRRSRVRRILPADVRVTDDGCLWIPYVENLRAALDAWENGLGHEIAAATLARFGRGPTTAPWQSGWNRGHQVSSGDAILVDYGFAANVRADWREYDGTEGILICLVPASGVR